MSTGRSQQINGVKNWVENWIFDSIFDSASQFPTIPDGEANIDFSFNLCNSRRFPTAGVKNSKSGVKNSKNGLIFDSIFDFNF